MRDPGTTPDDGTGDVEHDPRPIVRRPRAGLPGAAIAGAGVVAALSLFMILNGHRQQATRPPSATLENGFPSPPPLVLPVETQEPEPILPPMANGIPAFDRMPTPAATPTPRIPAMPPPKIIPGPPVAVDTGNDRVASPALVIDTDPGTAVTASGTPQPNWQSGGGGPPNVGDDVPIRATIMRNRSTIVAAGTIIPAVLETPIDSTRPGLVRAIVSDDARGFDGRHVLIARGSRLIGEYQSDVRSGQDRVLMTWTRLIRPDGVAIKIGSPAADPLGGAGVRGHVNTFFLRRFARAVLQSALTVGVNLASRPGNGSVIVGLPSGGVANVGQDLLSTSDLRPKITIRQGAAVDVLVAHDLDFSGASAAAGDGGH